MKRLLSFLLLLFTFSILSAQDCDMCGDWTGTTSGTYGGVRVTSKFYLRCKKIKESYTVQIKSSHKRYDPEEDRKYDDPISYWKIELVESGDSSIVFTCPVNGDLYEYTYKLSLVDNSIELWEIGIDDIHFDQNGEKQIVKHLSSQPHKVVTLYKDNDDW